MPFLLEFLQCLFHIHYYCIQGWVSDQFILKSVFLLLVWDWKISFSLFVPSLDSSLVRAIGWCILSIIDTFESRLMVSSPPKYMGGEFFGPSLSWGHKLLFSKSWGEKPSGGAQVIILGAQPLARFIFLILPNFNFFCYTRLLWIISEITMTVLLTWVRIFKISYLLLPIHLLQFHLLPICIALNCFLLSVYIHISYMLILVYI